MMSSKLHFRTAKPTDAAHLAQLEHLQYGAESYPAPLFYQAVAQWPQLQWVAADGDEIAGFVMAANGERANQIWIMSLLIGTNYRGMQLGKRLMHKVLDAAKRLGMHEACLTVAPENAAAIKLYHGLGFTEQAYLKDFLGPGEDRLQLHCKL